MVILTLCIPFMLSWETTVLIFVICIKENSSLTFLLGYSGKN